MNTQRKNLRQAIQVAQGNRFIPVTTSVWDFDKSLTTPEDYNSLIEAFKDWVYVCSSKNATSVAKATYKLYMGKKQGTKVLEYIETKDVDKQTLKYIESNPTIQNILRKSESVKEVKNHLVLDLLTKVNPFMDGFSLFELTQLFLELTGNAYWYIVKNRLGLPVEIWIIPSQYITVVPDKSNFISKYVYKKGFKTEITFRVEEIVHFKFPNPKSLYYGLSPSAAISEILNLKDNMNIFENSLLRNNARLEGVLTTDDELGETIRDRIKADWRNTYSGAGRAGGTPLLEKGLKYQPITASPKDLNFLEGRKVSKESIAGAHGVPMSLLGTDNVNLANAFIGDRQYMSNTILPRLRRLEEGINSRVLPIYDDSLFIVFDNPVPDDQEFLLKKKIAEIKVGYKTINEYREAEEGLPPVSWGNEPLEKKQETQSLKP